MPAQPFIVATAGHIDHGKSTLIEALSGTNPDRLPEEQKRGMTIELGFAHLDLVDPAHPNTHYELGLIDVPGHADFVKNMVAGVGGIDVALLVVAADDGWMPQTEEHFQILLYLGIRRMVVALTKSDVLVDRDLVLDDLRGHLIDTPFHTAPIVPVCALSGEGLDTLKSALAAILRSTPPPLDIGKPRLFVDRVFSPKGAGTVVTGTLSGGSFTVGQELILQPVAIPTRVRGLQNHQRATPIALPGTRTAVQLHDVPIATDDHPRGVRRGQALTVTASGSPSLTIDVWLQRSDREGPGMNPNSSLVRKPIRTGQLVRFHLGSGSHDARVYFEDRRELLPGESSTAELRFTAPVHSLGGDPFVLRDWTKQFTLAGGRVLDPQAQRRRFRRSPQQILLTTRAAALDEPSAWIDSLLTRDGWAPAKGLLEQTRFPSDRINATVEAMADVRRIGALWVKKSAWHHAVTTAREAILSLHRTRPEALGLKLGDLRSLTEPLLPDPKLFEVLLADLQQVGCVRGAGIIRASDHIPRLPPELVAAGDRLRKALSENPLEPPNIKDLTPNPTDQKALKFLIDIGDAIQLDDKAVLLTSAFIAAKDTIRKAIQDRGRVTASELREIVGTTRRILIPLLERLDKDHFTRRDGDFRTLGPAA